MKHHQTPIVIVSADREEFDESANSKRRVEFEKDAVDTGLKFKTGIGKWKDNLETIFVVTLTELEDRKKVMDLAKKYNQEFVCQVYSDSSAYQVRVSTGDREYKGTWKSVPYWRRESFLESDADYTYDPDADTYWYVGS